MNLRLRNLDKAARLLGYRTYEHYSNDWYADAGDRMLCKSKKEIKSLPCELFGWLEDD